MKKLRLLLFPFDVALRLVVLFIFVILSIVFFIALATTSLSLLVAEHVLEWTTVFLPPASWYFGGDK